MANLNVLLPADLRAFVDEQVTTEKYRNASEYLVTLVRAARKEKAEEKLIALVKEAEASGHTTPMTREDWDRIRRKAMKRLAAGKANHAQSRKKARSGK